MDNIIKLKQVSKIYSFEEQELKALDQINLEVKKGEFLVILGQSGCGKSTLLNLLGGMDKPTHGEALIAEKNLAHLKQNDLAKYRRQKIGMIFQKFNLIGDMSILENVMMPLKFAGLSEKKQKALAKEALDKVGLSKRIKSQPSKLSGGQQQRVAIARALVNNPEILLCDEPTGNLDSKTGQEIMELLCELNHKGHTIIMVTHNEEYSHFADHIVKMLDGKIIEEKFNKHSGKESAEFKSTAKTINLMSRLRLAMKNLKRRKVRFFLTSCGVAIGAMAIVVLVSFGAGLQKDVEKQVKSYSQVEEIQVSGEKNQTVSFSMGPEFTKGEKKPLNDKTIEDLSKIENVAAVYPSISFSGEMKYGDKVSRMFAEASAPLAQVKDEIKQKVANGKYFASDDANSAVIPYGQATALGFTNPTDAVGKEVTFKLGDSDKEYKTTIAGVIDQKEKFYYSTIFPNKIAIDIYKDGKTEELKKDNPDLYPGIVVRAKDSASVSAIKKTIDDRGYGTHSYEDIAKEFTRTFTIMQIVLGVVGGIALLVASLGITNTMLMSVLERTREIGIMKAVGARNKDISSVFLSEAFLIGLFGGLFGLLLGFLGSQAVGAIVNGLMSKSNPGGDQLSFYIPVYLSVGVVAFSALISSLAGYIPAKRAAKLDPVVALRDE